LAHINGAQNSFMFDRNKNPGISHVLHMLL